MTATQPDPLPRRNSAEPEPAIARVRVRARHPSGRAMSGAALHERKPRSPPSRPLGARAKEFVVAARVPEPIVHRQFGPWTITRIAARAHAAVAGRDGYAALCRRTESESTLHLPHGEIVMEDSDPELRQHLPIWLRARGRVLVTGLGLGCVVRGLLANGAVEHIDVIEIDQRVIEAVGAEFRSTPRVSLIHADARTWPIGGRRWDWAWHDLWTSEDEGHLQLVHAQVLLRFHDACASQGAWKLPRFVRRLAPGLATLW